MLGHKATNISTVLLFDEMQDRQDWPAVTTSIAAFLNDRHALSDIGDFFSESFENAQPLLS